jgi:ankyrin repeat protein
MTISKSRVNSAHSKSLVLGTQSSMVDYSNASSTNKAIRCKSDSELVSKGIKFTYKTGMPKSNVAIISSTSVTNTSSEVCPSTFLQSVLAESETDSADNVITQPLHQSDFIQPTSDQIEAYNQSNDAVVAVRAGDVNKLRQLVSCGAQLQVCNKYGESLLHMACRRSNAHVVSFLLHEANVSPRIRDDFGRTPLHDACWRGNPEYEIVEMLLEKEPRLAFVKDVRGHRPFQYARREHWPAWKEFLGNKKNLF